MYKNVVLVITLLFLLQRNPKGPAQIREIRSYKNYNQESFRQDIARVPWSIIESFEGINDAVEAWNNLFSDVANRHAP